jgi:hypothetical protein
MDDFRDLREWAECESFSWGAEKAKRVLELLSSLEARDLDAINYGSESAARILRGIAENGRTHGGVFGGVEMEAAAKAIMFLREERDRLQRQIEGHCDRIAKQSELLSRRAEKVASDSTR